MLVLIYDKCGSLNKSLPHLNAFIEKGFFSNLFGRGKSSEESSLDVGHSEKFESPADFRSVHQGGTSVIRQIGEKETGGLKKESKQIQAGANEPIVLAGGRVVKTNRAFIKPNPKIRRIERLHSVPAGSTVVVSRSTDPFNPESGPPVKISARRISPIEHDIDDNKRVTFEDMNKMPIFQGNKSEHRSFVQAKLDKMSDSLQEKYIKDLERRKAEFNKRKGNK